MFGWKLRGDALTQGVVKVQEANRRDVHLAFGIENKPSLDLPNQLRGVYQMLDLIELEYGCHRNASRQELQIKGCTFLGELG